MFFVGLLAVQLATPEAPVGPKSAALLLTYTYILIILAFSGKILVNTLLLVTSITGSLFLSEFLLINIAVPNASYSQRWFFPWQYRSLTFNTKDGVIPHDYALVVGDSYAAGMGTLQMYNVTDETKEPIHYLEMLHSQTKIDFLNTGIEGAGSLRGFWLHPTSTIEYLRNNPMLERIDDPSMVIALFYEGNDFVDNIFSISALTFC